ncbi:putative mitochondrial-processing peptidase [Echria macrotheca]|uniref:Mitochondrial-processing peptidase subunit alpha n=1 Tax=Echria macrotheca TaxID=438768 RepID=A0AAJ0F1U6_9PEZI|nr:putative mitochondrial-processing peptidase [Echria macrotheca]
MLKLCRPVRQLAAGRCRSLRLPSTSFRAHPLPAARTFASVVSPPPKAKDPTQRDKITTLPNGVRVASEDLPDAFSGVGVYIDAGSRYEDESLRGVSHLMDRLAFKSTDTRTAEEMQETVEKLGGNIQCASSRESMMYQAATFNSAIPTAVGLLADTIRNPRMTDDEVAEQLDTAAYEVKEIWAKPEMILPEVIHMAAFKDNTLGNPLLCPEERLSEIDRHVINKYRETFYRPERMVVAFAGVPHEEAVRLAEKYFGDMDSSTSELSRTGSETSLDSLVSDSSETSSSTISSSPPSPPPPSVSRLLSKVPLFKNLSTSAPHNASVVDSPLSDIAAGDLTRPAHYTGGFLSLPPQPIPLNPNMHAFTHIQLAFEGLSISDDDIYALATLQTLLGGGGSFSAGGPGKGMYSRLYTNVLNQHGWVDSCVAFNHAYTDSGIFGIAASCFPSYAVHMLQVMCRELQSLTHKGGYSALNEVEVARAKNQLRSSLLMNLESRMVELEDLGRQVQVHGRKIPVLEMTDRINNLGVHDLRRVAERVLSGMVNNRGGGSGAPTVVLQEVAADGGRQQVQLGWDQIQDIIYQWKLGKQ